MDVDTGVDDALAILLALHRPDLDLVGITTVSGNCSSEEAALNTTFLLRQFSAAPPIPVHVGALESLEGRTPTPADHVHGADGLGGVSEGYWSRRQSEQSQVLAHRDGVEFLLEMARRYADRLTVVATGPLTNLALAAREDTTALRRVGRVLVMGGAVERGGNVTESAEFNVHCDPGAYGVVFEAGIRLTLFPLDVTEKVILSRSRLADDSGLDEAKLRLIGDMTSTYMKFHAGRNRIDGCFVHDALPVAWLIDPSLFTLRRGKITVDQSRSRERGRMRWSGAGEAGWDSNVAVSVNAERFFELYWDELRRADLTCHYGVEGHDMDGAT